MLKHRRKHFTARSRIRIKRPIIKKRPLTGRSLIRRAARLTRRIRFKKIGRVSNKSTAALLLKILETDKTIAPADDDKALERIQLEEQRTLLHIFFTHIAEVVKIGEAKKAAWISQHVLACPSSTNAAALDIIPGVSTETSKSNVGWGNFAHEPKVTATSLAGVARQRRKKIITWIAPEVWAKMSSEERAASRAKKKSTALSAPIEQERKKIIVPALTEQERKKIITWVAPEVLAKMSREEKADIKARKKTITAPTQTEKDRKKIIAPAPVQAERKKIITWVAPEVWAKMSSGEKAAIRAAKNKIAKDKLHNA